MTLLPSESHRRILGEDFEYRFDPDMWAIRVNTLRASVESVRSGLESMGYALEPVPWCGSGFWVRTGDALTKTREFSSGKFFSQSASSMIPPIVLDPTPEDVVLDMAASPGSKTTQMAAMMGNRGAVVANDVSGPRIKALKSNVQRSGAINVAITQSAGEDIWRSGLKYTKVLLDAPCTGTGTMNPRILKATGERTIRRFSRQQRALIGSASRCLDEGGTLVYSTCSMEPEENEGVVDYAVTELGMRVEALDAAVPDGMSVRPVLEWGGEAFDASVSGALRVAPSERTEGFFVCMLRF